MLLDSKYNSYFFTEPWIKRSSSITRTTIWCELLKYNNYADLFTFSHFRHISHLKTYLHQHFHFFVRTFLHYFHILGTIWVRSAMPLKHNKITNHMAITSKPKKNVKISMFLCFKFLRHICLLHRWSVIINAIGSKCMLHDYSHVTKQNRIYFDWSLCVLYDDSSCWT